MTVGGTLCDVDGKVSRQHLFIIVQRLLELYTKRRLAKVMAGEVEGDPSRKGLRLAAIKVLLSQNARMAQIGHSPMDPIADPPAPLLGPDTLAAPAPSSSSPAPGSSSTPEHQRKSLIADDDRELAMEMRASAPGGVAGLQMPLRRFGLNGGSMRVAGSGETREAGTQTASVYVCF